MKKSKLSQIAAILFLVCLIITIRYFDNEAAGMFLIFAIGGFISSIWYAKNNL